MSKQHLDHAVSKAIAAGADLSSISDFLCDGAALAACGVTDSDQLAVDETFRFLDLLESDPEAFFLGYAEGSKALEAWAQDTVSCAKELVQVSSMKRGLKL